MDAGRLGGPLFVVGRPRSGTKLLRSLLNQHPTISIPVVETHFIAPAIRRFGVQPMLSSPSRFAQFYAEFSGSTFYMDMKAKGLVLAADQLAGRADLDSWASLINVILGFYGPKGLDHGGLLGDKTPSYLTHMLLLKHVLPEARFVHIIRDPRDYCLSMHKAWGRNLLRAAELWRREVQQARQTGRGLGPDYREVQFETLLSAPAQTLRGLCSFLGIEFDPAMVDLSMPAENLGDATGQSRIMDGNRQKFLSQLSPATVKRIEEVVYPVAGQLGYAPQFAEHFRPLHPTEAFLFKLQDGMGWTKFHIKEKGLRQGVEYLYRSH